MLQRYRLRLGDGTVLTVDRDGLAEWQEDARAVVQVAGTQQWRPVREVLAEEDSAARLARALVPPKPREEAAPQPAPPSWTDDVSAPAIGADPSLQVLADDPAPSAGDRTPPVTVEPDVPAIRLKPLDDEPAPTQTAYRPWSQEADEGDPGEEVPRHDRLDGPLLAVLSAFGALLSRGLDPLTPLVRGWPSARGKPAPHGDGRTAGTVKRASAWIEGLTGRVSGLTGRARWEPTVRTDEARRERASQGARPAPAPRERVKPPTPANELPALRLAPHREPSAAEDVYEIGAAGGSLATVWRWTVPIAVIGGLATGGVLAGLNWKTWFPSAAELGQTLFTEIDRQAHARQRTEEQERALDEAAAKLPHLAPGTIRRILSRSPGGVLDASEVFGLAAEAADRGLPALTAAEAAELGVLRGQVLGALRPQERERLREYDRARSRRVIFPFENPNAQELYARGTSALPAPSRQRLRKLLGKAVEAGLAPVPEVNR